MLALLHQHPPSTAKVTAVSAPPSLLDPSALMVLASPPSLLSSAASTPASTPKETTRPFQCQEPGCGRRFNRKFTLSEHMKTHTGEKPYTCPVATCGKRFSTSGNLARHKRLHASIKPFECTIEGCKRSFPNELKLQQHLKIHLGGKSHMCKTPGCGKSFSTAGNLTRHMKNHHHCGSLSSAPSSCCTSAPSSTPSSPYSSSSPVSVTGILDYSAMSLPFLPGPGPTNVPLTSYATMGLSPPLHPAMTNLYYAFHGADADADVEQDVEVEVEVDACADQLPLGYDELPYLPSLALALPPADHDHDHDHSEHGLFDDVIRFQLTQTQGHKMTSIYEN